MFGVCLLFNNVLHIGEPDAIAVTLFVGAALTFSGLFLKLKKREKKMKAPKAPEEPAAEEESMNEK